MLIVAVIFALEIPVVPKFSLRQNSVLTESSPGLGGGIFTGEIDLIMENDELNQQGISEPEEFSRPRLLVFNSYRVEKGDTIGQIAKNAGLNEDTVLSINGIKNSRLLQINQILKIPNQDGIYHIMAKNETLLSVAEKHKTEPEAIKIVNELFTDSIDEKAVLFIPGAKMDWVNRQEINGDLFIWPVAGYITSSYGYRENPFGGGRQFHYGLDIGASSGVTVRAAMAGRITFAGYNDTYGNYVVISHHSGYRTLYAHMSVISTKSGAYVATGEQIGLVGSTGISTAPHVHFTVYKNGVTVNPRSLMK
jgi:murein DD-endopeptidase MepM/ murein hydrolase activator NlpD